MKKDFDIIFKKNIWLNERRDKEVDAIYFFKLSRNKYF